MSNVFQEAAEAVLRTFAQTFVYNGRSRRLDVGYYWLVSMLIAAGFQVAVSNLLEWDAALISRWVLDCALAIPFLALFARRAHDQNRSGLWALMLLPVPALGIYRQIRVTLLADPSWPDLDIWSLALVPVVVLMLVMIFIPGSVGTNRYGPDPRLEPEAEAAV